MIKPKRLEKGDTIAVVSPPCGLAGLFPHRLDNAIKFFESQGYRVKELSSTRKNKDWEPAPTEERTKDLVDVFRDKDVKALIWSAFIT